MTKEEIYNALNPSWWISQLSPWGTLFMSAVIVFNTNGITGCTFTSSAPYQTNGLNAGTGPSTDDLTDFVNNLRTEVAQRLFDEHCIAITGNQSLGEVFNATG